MDLTITNKILDEDLDEIHRNIHAYNIARIEDKNPEELGIYMKDESGKMLAGLIGETHGNWLSVEFLWVSEELRRKGIGSSILKKAEETAREKGCKYAFLDTFSFQAPEFYKKHGYREVFALEQYPVTGKRYYFTKNL